jgi:error-prone DNA polymerase
MTKSAPPVGSTVKRAGGSGTFAPLWCKSNFSFLQAASHPEELVEAAHALGYRTIGLADLDGVYGVVEAHMKAKELGVHLILGSQVTVDDGSAIVLLAQSREGYANLCRLITKGRMRCEKGKSKVSWTEVCRHATGLLALWGGPESLLTAPAEPMIAARMLREAFGDRLYALLDRHFTAEQSLREKRVRQRALRYDLPLVAAPEILFHAPERRPLHDVLTCIRHGVKLSEAGRLLLPNDRFALTTPQEFAQLYRDVPEALERTAEIAARCTFTMDEIRYRYPSETLPSGKTSAEHLCDLTFDGARGRYGGTVPDDVRAQLDKELALIDELDYPGYFLTMWEIVQFCRRNEILCQGRGSAANSAVCYCLGITAVDPVRMDLLFERFLSRERAEPPDIDLDISHQRREEVIAHMYEKYGRNHAAMVANIIRYRGKSAVREVGKVLGLPETGLDRLSKLLGHRHGLNDDFLTEAGLDPNSKVHEHLMARVAEIIDFPRHLSIHPGGFLLGHEPVHDLVPIENASMEGRTVIQWDKESVENLGLFKVDLLGLGALTQLDLAFQMLKAHRGVEVSMATIPPDDDRTFEMIRAGDTVGVFQIESRAQMSMLPRLKPKTFYDIVIEISIVRPGPISGGMVHPYLRRRAGEEEADYPHECLRPVLEKTLGVPLFQEQVIKLAMVAADYTPGEADQLRRDMAAWRKTGRILRHKERLVGRMVAKGIEVEFAERVFEQIRGFGEYGFPESHAASFALISYASAWLRTHYPAEFACSILNAQPMGFYTPSTLIQDAQRHHVPFFPVDVSISSWDCALEKVDADDYGVRMGLRYVRRLGEHEWERIGNARDARPFDSIEDFVRRTNLAADSVAALSEIGAFNSLAVSRRDALWRGLGEARVGKVRMEIPDTEQRFNFPELDDHQTILWDYRAGSHSTNGHPLMTVRAELSELGLPNAKTLNARRNGSFARFAGLVICRQQPGTAKGVTFMTMEDETGWVNVIVWQNVFERFHVILKTEPFLGVTGQLQSEHGVVHLIAKQLWVPNFQPKAPPPKSYDFH